MVKHQPHNVLKHNKLCMKSNRVMIIYLLSSQKLRCSRINWTPMIHFWSVIVTMVLALTTTETVKFDRQYRSNLIKFDRIRSKIRLSEIIGQKYPIFLVGTISTKLLKSKMIWDLLSSWWSWMMVLKFWEVLCLAWILCPPFYMLTNSYCKKKIIRKFINMAFATTKRICP